jgi:hypothetical protein
MEETKRQLIFDLALGRIGVEAFVMKFGIDPRIESAFIGQGLDRALAEKASADLEALMILAHRFGLWRGWASILSALLVEPWHTSHEDIADALQDIRDPMAVGALTEAAQTNHKYLAYDDAHALAVKCIWALHDIGSEDAKEKLTALTESKYDVIRCAAQERLKALATRKPGEPEPAYRKWRDLNVRDGG